MKYINKYNFTLVLKKTKQIISKDFVKNFLSLTIFQIIELFVPLLSIPLIISKVGTEKFGLISFALIISYFFQLIIDFGFNTISIRDISVNSNDKVKINEIFNNTINSKLILSVFVFIIYSIIIFIFERFNSNIEIYIFTFLSLVIQSFIPNWFFQGLQLSKYITFSSSIGRLLYLFFIIFFVNEEKNFLLVPVFNLIGYFISLIISLIFILKKFKIKYYFINFNSFISQINKGKYMFFSEVKLYFISYFNIFILGLLSGNLAVAYFVGAEKIIRAFSTIFIPVQNSLFPILAVKLNKNKLEATKLIKRILLIAIVVLTINSIILFILSETIISLILGNNMKNSIIVFRILIFVPLLTFLDLFFGKQILLNLRKEKEFFRVVLIIAIINVPLIYFFITKYSYIGASVSQIITQTLLVLGMFYYAKKALEENN